MESDESPKDKVSFIDNSLRHLYINFLFNVLVRLIP